MVERVWALGGTNLFVSLKCEDIPCVYQPGNPTVVTSVTVDTARSAAKQLSGRMYINSIINRSVTTEIQVLYRVQKQAIRENYQLYYSNEQQYYYNG